MPSNCVLGSSKSSTGTLPPHISAARTKVVLLIRRTVRPRGYASGFDFAAAFWEKRVPDALGWVGATKAILSILTDIKDAIHRRSN